MQSMILSSMNFLRLLGRKASIAFLFSMIAGLTLSLIEAGFAGAFAIVLKLLGATDAPTPFDSYLNQLGENQWCIIAILPCLATARAIVLWTIDQGVSTLEEVVRGRLRQISMYRLLFSQGDRYLSASDVNTLNGTVFNGAILFISAMGCFVPFALTAAGLLAWMLYIKPFQSLFAVLGIAAVGVIFIRQNRRITRLTTHQISLSETLNATVTRIAQNSIFIRCSDIQAQELASISQTNSNSVLKVLRARAIATAVNLFPTIIGVSLITSLLYLQIRKGPDADSMNFISMVYLMMRLVDALSRASRAASFVLPQYVFYKRAREFFFESNKEERLLALAPFHNNLEFKTPIVPPKRFEKFEIASPPPKIEINNLFYAFKSTGRELYNGLTFSLEPGQQLGLIGPSGTGKSTLLSLVLGFTRPMAGQILIDGKTVENLRDHPGLRVGFVSAEPFLFAGTIKENLDYGHICANGPADYREILTALMLFKQGEDLDALLARPIREDLSGLSMGEKQRLCLARALLRRPNLLILDEITANLDARTESEIVGILKKLEGSTTIIFVSHRMNALAGADYILDLETNTILKLSELRDKILVA